MAPSPDTLASTPRFSLDVLQKYWPLLTTVVLGVTNGALVIIFKEWNVAFPQLASASDIAAINFVVGVVAVFVPLMIWPAAAMIDLLGSAVGPARQPYLILALAILVGLLALAGWLSAERGHSLLYSTLWAGLGLAAYTLYRSKHLQHSAWWRSILILPSVLACGAAIYLWSLMMSQTFIARGFVGERWVAKSDKIPCEGQVMWMGEKATIIRCAADAPPSNVAAKAPPNSTKPPSRYVIIGKDGLVLTHDRPPAKTPEQPATAPPAPPAAKAG
ncbi:hypothetical protein DDF62_02225 [Caulobacter radicis]|uniref:hypothetical protein n=1 Tax=Caulobacter radicis TaxID=2172650 RepID=UPI000D5703E4|nr:hypothetical protein [Caulobacter radicis]PVM92838.1 hypothetical protein DDF62_02225 [Caulobacter radicis]